MLSKFLPLLREYVPDAVEDIEADVYSHASRQGFFEQILLLQEAFFVVLPVFVIDY